MTAQGYFDAEGRQVESAALGAVDAARQPLSLVPSTLGVPQSVEGPVAPKDALDLALSSVYRLAPEVVDAGLSVEVAARTSFQNAEKSSSILPRHVIFIPPIPALIVGYKKAAAYPADGCVGERVVMT